MKVFIPKFITILTIILLGCANEVNAQVVHIIGTYNSQGVPDYLESTGDVLSSDFLSRIDAAVPEGYDVPTYHPSYLSNNFMANVEINQATDLYMTFVHEGAGYKNVLGYYKYPTGNPPSSTSDLDTLYVVFPNASFAGAGGGLYSGDKVNVGTIDAGYTVGFFIIANGYNSSTASVGSGNWTLFSNDGINPNTDPAVRKQVIVLYDDIEDKYVICFEDIRRPSGDKDFNDAIFYLTASDPSAVGTDDIAALPRVWEGTVDSDWFNVNNWNPAVLPDSSSNVSISASATHAPIITSDVNIDAITVEPGASVEVEDGVVLDLEGDFTALSGGLEDVSIKLSGDHGQYIYGTPEFEKLIVESTDTVHVDESITVNGDLDVSSGVLKTYDNVTVVNDQQDPASVREHDGGEIDGEITVVTVIPSPNGYHYVSSPVEGQTLADLNDDFTLVGLGGNLTSSPFPNMWIYNELDSGTHATDGWITPSSLSHPMGVAEGFAFNVNAGVEIDLKGEPITGTITLPLSHTVTPGEHGEHCPPDGWQLMGNPYPTPIDWDKVGLQNIDNGIHVWDPYYDRYMTYIDGVGVNGGSRYIATMQGFFIRTNVDDSTLTSEITFADSMKVDRETAGVVFRSSSDTLMLLNLIGPAGQDQIGVKFSYDGLAEYDNEKDAFKMFNSNPLKPNFASRSSVNSYLYSVNSLPSLAGYDTIPLFVEAGTAGTYEIQIDQNCSFLNFGDAWIYDSINGSTIPIDNGAFSFYLSDQEETNRYRLIVKLSSNITDVQSETGTFEVMIYSDYQHLYLTSNQPIEDASIRLYTIDGKEFFAASGVSLSRTVTSIQVPCFSSGIYVVTVDSNLGNRTERISLLNR